MGSTGNTSQGPLGGTGFEVDFPITKGLHLTTTIGPVVLSADLGSITLKLAMDFELTQVSNRDNVFAGYCGFYGGKGQVGVKYDVEFKWGFIPVKITADAYHDSKKWNETVAYAGPIEAATAADAAKMQIKFTTGIDVGNKVSAWELLYAKLDTEMDLIQTFTIDATKFKGKGDLEFKVWATEGIGFDVAIFKLNFPFAKQNIFDMTIPLFEYSF